MSTISTETETKTKKKRRVRKPKGPDTPVSTPHLCPRSGQPILEYRRYRSFPGFPGVKFWRRMSGRDLSIEEHITLAKAHPKPVKIDAFVTVGGYKSEYVTITRSDLQFMPLWWAPPAE